MYLIGDIVRLNAKRYPDKKAVIMENRYLTFTQLNRSANQLANGLLAMGLRPGDRVALLAYNCLEFPIINYAVAKFGGILVPVNFRFKKDELVHIINNCEPKAFFFGSEFIPLVEDGRSQFSFADPSHPSNRKALRGRIHLIKFDGRAIILGTGCQDPSGLTGKHHIYERDNWFS